MTTDTDLRAVELARKGDTAAFERIYRRHAGRIHGLCLRMTGSRSEAEDLTQEAFVRAWQRLGGFRGEAAFSTWLHRVAVNVVLGRRRTLSRRPEGHSDGDQDLVPAAGLTGGSKDAALDLERAIEGLPERARQVFVLHDVEGYTHEEISELADMAVGTSKAHLSRARRMLREVLRS